MKTIVVLIGNARGGETTWGTLYKNLLDVYEADLALCFGQSENKQSSLYQRANYIWEIPEYKDWREYYKNLDGFWEKSFMLGEKTGLAGGLGDICGSGAVIFAFRHFLKNNYIDILKSYNRIILTRSDQFYTQPHIILPNDNIWAVEGEDYNGITDRHHIFPSKYLEEMLGVIDYMNTETGYKQISEKNHPNPELVLSLSLEYFKVNELIKRFNRFQFTVATKDDQTRWSRGILPVPHHDNLYIKYESEYFSTLHNINKTNKLF
jgi:hypothetical protein